MIFVYKYEYLFTNCKYLYTNEKLQISLTFEEHDPGKPLWLHFEKILQDNISYKINKKNQ